MVTHVEKRNGKSNDIKLINYILFSIRLYHKGGHLEESPKPHNKIKNILEPRAKKTKKGS